MNKRQIAKLVLNEIMFVISQLQQKYPEFQLYIPPEIRVDDEAFSTFDLHHEAIERGFEFGGNLNVLHNGGIRNAAELLNEMETTNQDSQ